MDSLSQKEVIKGKAKGKRRRRKEI